VRDGHGAYDRYGMDEALAPRYAPPDKDALPVDAVFGPGR